MTTFKVGDKVRLTGASWKDHGMLGAVYEVKRIVGDTPQIIDIHHRHLAIYRDGMDYSATLIEPPPEGVLCLVRLAGDKGTDSYTARFRGGQWWLTGWGHRPSTDVVDWCELPSWDRLDEVRRRTGARKRLVYEEIDGKDARCGDMYSDKSGFVEEDRDPVGDTVYRLVEET